MIQQSSTAIHHPQFSSQNIAKLIQNPSVSKFHSVESLNKPMGFCTLAASRASLIFASSPRMVRIDGFLFIPSQLGRGKRFDQNFLSIYILFKKRWKIFCHNQLLDVRFFLNPRYLLHLFVGGGWIGGGIRIVLYHYC